MIATAQSCKLEPAVATKDGIELRMTERVVGDAVRRTDHRPTIPAARRHRALQSSEDFPSDNGIAETIRSNIKWHGQNTAADIATHRLRIDQMLGTHRHANADIRSKVDIGHDGHVL